VIKLSDGKQKDVHEFHMQFIESLNEALNHYTLELQRQKTLELVSPKKDEDMKEEEEKIDEADVDMELEKEPVAPVKKAPL